MQLYRRCYTWAVVRTAEYVLTPNSRFYIFIIGQVLLMILIVVSIRFWIALFEAAMIYDPSVRAPVPDRWSSIFDYAVYVYSVFTSEFDPYANVPYLETLEIQDNFDYMYDSMEYQRAIIYMAEDFEAGVEDFEERSPRRFFEPVGKAQFMLRMDQPDQVVPPPALHYYYDLDLELDDTEEPNEPVSPDIEAVDDEEAFVGKEDFFPEFLTEEEEKHIEEYENALELEKKFYSDWAEELLKSLENEYAIERNRLSSVSRVYLSGFFDYGYEYLEPQPKQLFDFPEELLTDGVPLSHIDFTDLIIDTEIIYDDIISVTIDLARGEEINEKSGLYNSFEVFEDKEKDATDELLGIENIERSFVHYANAYSEDIYDDFFDPYTVEEGAHDFSFICLHSDIRQVVR